MTKPAASLPEPRDAAQPAHADPIHEAAVLQNGATPTGDAPATKRKANGSPSGKPRRQPKAAQNSPLLYVIKTFWPFMRPYWWGVAFAVLAVIGITIVGLLKPWPLKVLVDNVLNVGQPGARPLASTQTIAAIAGAIVAIAVINGLLSYVKQFFMTATSQRVAFAIRSALFLHIQRLPLAFHDRQRTGDLITRVTSDVSRVQELLTDDLLLGGATHLLQLVGMLVVMLVLAPQLGLIASLSAPLIFFTTWYYRRRIRAEEVQVRAKEGDIASLAQETISSIKVVKAFGRGRFEAQRFEAQTGEMLEASIKVTRLEAAFSWILNVVTALSLAALVSIGAYQVLAGVLSAGVLIVFIDYMRNIQGPLTSLSRLSAKIAKATIRAERLMEVLNERPAIEERPHARTAPRFQGQIRFEDVSFGYDPAQLVLQDIDITIEPGQRVAIVGPTGAGKSTLAGLLLRLYDPLTGRVLIDGQDIRDYKLDSVVDQIGIVLQESLLFQTTIRENIAYGKPNATSKEIQAATRTAYCDEFIAKLPHGLDTVVGERGGTLSGGQRQRIAIARAVIRDAPILILDEPTTGLDAESEQLVLQALDRLMAGRTTLMIVHRFDTARCADLILMIDHGRIVEQGTHDALVARGGRYAELYRMQTGDTSLPDAAREDRMSTAAAPDPAGTATDDHPQANGGSRVTIPLHEDELGMRLATRRRFRLRRARGVLIGAGLLVLLALGGFLLNDVVDNMRTGAANELLPTPTTDAAVAEQGADPSVLPSATPAASAVLPSATPAASAVLPSATPAPSPQAATPTPTPPATPTLPAAAATIESIAAAEAGLRSGQFDVVLAYGNGARSTANVRFDLGDQTQPPRLHMLTTYESADQPSTVEYVTIADQAWQRSDNGDWTALPNREGIWTHVQSLLPRAASLPASTPVEADGADVRWYDPAGDADVTLVLDPANGMPRELRRTTRSTGEVLTVNYRDWNTPVDIVPPAAQ